jgi:hypothetical protein
MLRFFSCLQVILKEVPSEPRPDFGAMMGGVLLQDVHLTLRNKTDKLVLADASLQLLAGDSALITGALIEMQQA